MSPAIEIQVPERSVKTLRVVAVACGAVAVVGLFVAPRTTWSGYLVAFGLFSGLALAGPLFLAIHNLSGARWSATLVPIAEALTRTLPVAAWLGLALLGGIPSLYEWSHPEAVAADALLLHKAAWLNIVGFAVRLVAFFALWIWLGGRLIGTASFPGVPRESRIKRSALYMAVFGITYSLACVDWFQSVEPHWFSTIYGLLGLAGIGSSGLALVMLVTVVLRRAGALRRDDGQLGDLGKLALSLSLFWAYVGFCQYMLIWYTNNPEETPWYELRHARGWYALGVANVILNWLVPFLVLMPRKCRQSETVIFRVAVVMIVGRVVDLFIMLMPPLSGTGPRLGLFEAAPIVGALALFAFVFIRALGRSPAPAVGATRGTAVGPAGSS
jgi:hypothetical protein